MALRLIMARSADGFVARGPKDDMKWTGRVDKAVFKILTLQGDQKLAAGRVTFEQLPPLPGRKVYCLSTRGQFTLDDLEVASHKRDFCLIGGQTVALQALRRGMVQQATIVCSDRYLYKGIRDKVTPWLNEHCHGMHDTLVTFDVRVAVFDLVSRQCELPFKLEP